MTLHVLVFFFDHQTVIPSFPATFSLTVYLCLCVVIMEQQVFFFTLALIAEGTAEYQFIMPLFSSKTFIVKNCIF